MIIGIDIGGTHSDGVLIDQGKILKKQKSCTDENNIEQTVIQLVQTLIHNIKPSLITKVSLSTTLVTNLLSKHREEKAGLFFIPGLGAPVAMITDLIPHYYFSQSGYIDHRGIEAAPLTESDLKNAAMAFKQASISTIAVASKFSVRNHEQELQAEKYFKTQGFTVFKSSDYSGKLNFPRRCFTAFLTASICKAYSQAIESIEKGIRTLGISCPIFILKADGGAVHLKESLKYPLESVLSGPAASIMGALYSKETFSNEDTIVLDIGGTTTDLGFFIEGEPLLEPEGIKIREYNTLIRALKVYALPMGGDTLFQSNNQQISFDNNRQGVAYVFGGPTATLTDVSLALEKNDSKALEGLKKVLPTEHLKENLERILDLAAEYLYQQVMEKILEINSKPIYTVNDFFERRVFSPDKILLAGGAAPYFKTVLEKKFSCNVVLTQDYETCNAIGTAFSQITAELNLFANTADQKLSIPEINFYAKPPAGFNLETAKTLALEKLQELSVKKGLGKDAELEITEASSFNMVRGFSSSGKSIRVKAQVKPSLNPNQ